MPKVPTGPKAKTITVVYKNDVVRVSVEHSHLLGPREVLDAIRRQLKISLSEMRIVDDAGRLARLSWTHLRTDITYYVRPAALAMPPTVDPVDQPLRGKKKDDRMHAILQAWNLTDVSQIFPDEIAPRLPLANGEKAAFEDNGGLAEKSLLPPEQWSKSFVSALFKLAMDMPLMHKEAIDMVHQAMKDRREDILHVQEVLPSDLDRALQLRKARLQEVAKEVLENVTFSGGLWESIEEVKEEMEVEDGLGRLAM